MTDKVQKIREEVEMVVNRRLNLLNGDYFDLNKEVDGFTNEIMDIIDSLQEEPVSENLEEASKNYADNEEYGDDVYFAIKASFKAGARWQKEQDQSTIELAEDHAMLAGMEKMKEEMMEKAVDGWVFRDIKEGKLRISDNKECWNGIRISEKSIEKSYLVCTTDDAIKVKLVIVKED